jgi:sulfur-carrier protein
MSIKVLVPTPLRPHTDGAATVDVEGATVKGVLDALGTKHPALVQRLFDGNQLKRFLNLYLNDEDVRFLDELDTVVKEGDELAIIPAVAGG